MAVKLFEMKKPSDAEILSALLDHATAPDAATASKLAALKLEPSKAKPK